MTYLFYQYSSLQFVQVTVSGCKINQNSHFVSVKLKKKKNPKSCFWEMTKRVTSSCRTLSHHVTGPGFIWTVIAVFIQTLKFTSQWAATRSSVSFFIKNLPGYVCVCFYKNVLRLFCPVLTPAPHLCKCFVRLICKRLLRRSAVICLKKKKKKKK